MENKKESQKYRETKITSVSVSPFFKKLVDEYELSPTEIFRKGVAVSLYDLGVPRYSTLTNSKRNEYVKQFLKDIEQDERQRELFENIKLFEAVMKNLDSLKQLIAEIEK